jgi:putative ABC transport system ATP-binding protein
MSETQAPPQPAAPLISLRGVSKRYRGAPEGERALKGVSLKIERGEIVAIVGTSGSGKSTLLNVLGGLDRSFEGEVMVDGSDLRALSDAALSAWRNQRVGFVFQHFHLLDHLSALHNVTLPACLGRGDRSAEEIRARATALLTRLGLSDKINARPTQLSGGQKQRVAIARALLFEPSLLLCDEPTGSLDTRTGDEIISLFQALNAEGYTVVMITHEERVSRAARRVIRLEDGAVVRDEVVAPATAAQKEST